MPLTTKLDKVSTPLLITRFLRFEVAGVLRRSARALGINRPPELLLDELQIPDSTLTRAATALAKKVESPSLLNHSLRAFCFGSAVGKHLEMRADPELLYLAAILHDLGLVPMYDGEGSFEVNGARVAHEFLLGEGMPAERADRVHEAIALHAAIGIAGNGEPELALLHFGAGLDVVGFHAENVAPATRDRIVERYPRLQFKRDFSGLITDQAARKPRCHIAGHVALGFAGKIRAAPFAE